MRLRPAPRARPKGLSPLGLGLLAAAVSAGCARPSRPPDVILVTVDTLRADHLGAYGYDKPTSPVLDALARRATLFENAFAQAPHTIPSLLQIMTGRYAQGAAIGPDERTLAELLQARGYETAAVVENPNLEQHPTAHGLRRGFARFYRNGLIDRESVAGQLYKTNTPADAVTAQAVRFLRRRDRGRPLFLWVHYCDPHDPYLPPYADDLETLSRGSRSLYTGDVRATALYCCKPAPALPEEDRQHLVDLYDAEVRYTDQSLGDLFEYLRAEGLFEQALVVFSADHGESLGEHGVWTHGRSVYEPEIHIPLLVKRPGQTRAARVREAAEAIDILPTVLDVARLPRQGLGLDGRSVFEPSRAPAFVFWRDFQVVRTADWKLVQQAATVRLYRVSVDPGEQQDLFAARPDVVASLLAARDERLRQMGHSADELERQSEAVSDNLRGLGYLAH